MIKNMNHQNELQSDINPSLSPSIAGSSNRRGNKHNSVNETRWRFSVKVWLMWFFMTVVAFVWMLPAALFNGVQLGPVFIKEAAGSIWHGQVRLGVAGQLGGEIPGVWAWRLGWNDGVVVWLSGSLMRQEVRIKPKWDDGFQVSFGEGAIDLPAQWLEQLGSAFPTVRPRGTLNLTWEAATINMSKQSFKVDSAKRSADQAWASVLWRDASLAISRYNPLGTYRLLLQPQETRLVFDLNLITEYGVLNATGRGAVGVYGAQFKARLSADRDHAAMNRLLEFIGQKRIEDNQIVVDL